VLLDHFQELQPAAVGRGIEPEIHGPNCGGDAQPGGVSPSRRLTLPAFACGESAVAGLPLARAVTTASD
jgi:hypothetical protein